MNPSDSVGYAATWSKGVVTTDRQNIHAANHITRSCYATLATAPTTFAALVSGPGATADTADAIPRGQGRILFVDDETALAHVGETMLTTLGYDVVSYTDSAAALVAFRAAPERFDLVITDQTMPHLTGADLARALRELRPDIPIILCTGFSHTMSAEQAAQLGLDAFCMKPLRLREVALTIQRVLTQHSTRQHYATLRCR